MTESIDQQLARLVQTYKRTDDIFHAYAVKQGLSDCAFWILYALCEDDQPCAQNDLCEKWYYSKQTVHSAVSSLMKADYVSLSHMPGSRNRKLIILTPAGRKYVKERIRPVMDAEERALARLSAEERSQYIVTSERHTQFLADEVGGIDGAVIPT